jgi:quercetin dioxygenase-like cupin family protein
MEKQDPVEVSPHIYKVLLENDKVRVLDIHMTPREKSPEHSHPAHVLYIVSDGKVKFSYPGGESEELEALAGQTMWSDEMTHEPENTDTTEVHAVCVELKE